MNEADRASEMSAICRIEPYSGGRHVVLCFESKAAISIGEDAEFAAVALHRKRRWTWIAAKTLEEAARIICARAFASATVVLNRKSTTAKECLRFSELLASSQPSCAASLIVGDSATRLQDLVQRIPADPVPQKPSMPRGVLIHGDFVEAIGGTPLEKLSLDDRVRADPASVLGVDYGLLYLIGHSNGHDAGFDGSVICCRETKVAPASGANAFPCYFGGSCRFDLKKVIRIAPQHIKTRKLVNLTCWGISLSDFPFSSTLSVGDGFLEAGHVDCMISFVRAAPLDRRDLLALHYLIGQGLPFGRVVALANEARLRRGQRADFFCIGDPEGSIEPSIDELDCEWSSDKFAELRPRAIPSGSLDVVARLPQANASISKIAIAQTTNGSITAGLLVGDRIFLSLSNYEHDPEIAVSLTSIDEECDVLTSVLPIMDRVAELERIAKFVAREAVDKAHDLQLALEELRNCLGNWPFYRSAAGDVLIGPEISEAFTILSQRLDYVGACFLSMYQSMLERGGTYLMGHACKNQVSHKSTAVESDVCTYCGDAIDDETCKDVTGRVLRTQGYCYSCGPVYEISETAGKWLHIDRAWQQESQLRVILRVRNPYKFAVKVHVVVAIRIHDAKNSPAVNMRTDYVSSDSEIDFELILDLPTDLYPGVYYLHACTLLGSAVNFHRRPLVIEPGTPDARLQS